MLLKVHWLNLSRSAKVTLVIKGFTRLERTNQIDKTPLERAKILEDTSLFEEIHTSAASSGQTEVPEDLDTDLHFTCFVRAPEASARATETDALGWRVIELDGGRNGPIDRGKCTNLLQVGDFDHSHNWIKFIFGCVGCGKVR